MDILIFWDLAIDSIEELDEFLVPMALSVLPDHGTIQDIECCKQRGCAVADVVVMGCTPPAPSVLGIVECLAGNIPSGETDERDNDWP